MESKLFNYKAKDRSITFMIFYKVGEYIIMYDKEADTYVCSCPSFTYRKIECKHIKFLRTLDETEKGKYVN
jgi:predicted nucleic acid-binding Zn finger protein